MFDFSRASGGINASTFGPTEQIPSIGHVQMNMMNY
jgi:hypothetical protein